MLKIAVALGAGGARGLAEIVMCEAFEELGVRPYAIAGTSIGAIIGSVFAAGKSTREIKDAVDDLIFNKNIKFWEINRRSELIRMFDFINPVRRGGGVLKGQKFLKFLGDFIGADDFQHLGIPLQVVASDYKHKKQKVFSEGDLLSAIRASYSLPGLFMPTEIDGDLYVDGGMVNPLPYDLLMENSDLVVALGVIPETLTKKDETPPAFEILFSSFQIMQNSILREKLKRTMPDILIRAKISGVRVHEFWKAYEIFSQAVESKELLKRKLSDLIEKKLKA